ncbi:hypothetical protein [Glycomyces sp. MUSA5-2]|uniref:hypothetical protein n=1 Tax=Glycomyces sp. MUSA5-2 TaxID=2053002 RepID=UPI00300B421A
MNPDDVKAAARLVALALAPGRRPTASNEYGQLMHRCLADEGFIDLVRAIARGFDLEILHFDSKAGLVLGTTDETPFKTSLVDLARAPDRPIYLLAHLLIAAEAYPGPRDLDDASFIGRVSVDTIDRRARDAISLLERKAVEAGEALNPPVDQPGLEMLWRHYSRRPSSTAEGGGRSTTRVLVKRALGHLKDQGMMTQSSNELGGTFTTTDRYRIHVRELAGYALLEELASLGIATMPTSSATPPPSDDATLWNP